MAGVFDGIEDVKKDEGDSSRPFITEGTYILELERSISKKGTNPAKDSFEEDIVITEFTVLEVLRSVEGVSLKAGEQCVDIKVLFRKRDVLTDQGKRNMGRVKAIYGAALGGVPDEAVTAAACGKIVEGAGTLLAGTRVKCAAVRGKPSKTNGKVYTNLTWSFVG